jgi:hypothetical protein
MQLEERSSKLLSNMKTIKYTHCCAPKTGAWGAMEGKGWGMDRLIPLLLEWVWRGFGMLR